MIERLRGRIDRFESRPLCRFSRKRRRICRQWRSAKQEKQSQKESVHCAQHQGVKRCGRDSGQSRRSNEPASQRISLTLSQIASKFKAGANRVPRQSYYEMKASDHSSGIDDKIVPSRKSQANSTDWNSGRFEESGPLSQDRCVPVPWRTPATKS